MTTVISSFATVSCDGECGKTVTFAQTQEGEKEAFDSNAWLNGMRMVQTIDKRQFSYCSDECEIKAVSSGAHNKVEKKIITGNQSQVDLAAKAAHAAAQATQAMKSGAGIQIHQ